MPDIKLAAEPISIRYSVVARFKIVESKRTSFYARGFFSVTTTAFPGITDNSILPDLMNAVFARHINTKGVSCDEIEASSGRDQKMIASIINARKVHPEEILSAQIEEVKLGACTIAQRQNFEPPIACYG